jgi:hypothetical protein
MKNAATSSDLSGLHAELRDIAAKLELLAQLAKTAVAASERKSKTIKQLCAKHCISESSFFKMCRQKKGPKMIAIGASRRITPQAEDAWLRELEVAAAREPVEAA